MKVLTRHAILTAVSLVVAIALIWWTGPSPAGATFLVVVVGIIVNAFGSLVIHLTRKQAGLSALLLILAPSLTTQTSCASVEVVSGPESTRSAGIAAALGGLNGGLAGGILTQRNNGTGSIAADRSKALSEQSLRPGRVFLRASDLPPPGVGAYGVLALRAQQTPANKDRLIRVCTSFLHSLPPQASFPASVPPKDQMITVWPISKPLASQVVAGDCDYLTKNYDLYGGLSAIEDAEGQSHHLIGRGPFLIGWSPSSKRGQPDVIVLVLDMSHLTTQEDFDNELALWQEKIVQNPSLWRTGFSIDTLRIAIRDFANSYGDSIMSGIRFWRVGD